MPKENEPRDYLKRLAPHYYKGAAWVHWVMTIEKRATGWLDHAMHAAVRESLLHTMVRYRLVCPVYCLMPDHAHFLWCGCTMESDQRKAASFFRRDWNTSLGPRGFELQKQPFDHVLIKDERDPHAFEETCVYIMKNPERAELVEHWPEWGYSGTIFPGYPRLDAREDRFWPRMWTAYNGMRDPATLS